jgi:hypothetical protein
MDSVLSGRVLVLPVILFCLACTSSAESEAVPQQPAPPPGKSDVLVIDHITPRRDFTGPAPTRFEWTPVAGADEYAIGLWNESDTLVWRQGGIEQAGVSVPEELSLEPGTYYWSVVGVKDGRPIAESGLSAFVVLTADPASGS